MSFFKRLVPVKAKVWLSLDKASFMDGEPVVGKVNIEASEYLQANEIRVEARVFEHYTEPVWVVINNQRVQEMQRKTNTLFSQDVRVSGQTDVGSGPARNFPFSVSMPYHRSQRAGGSIENSVKGVIAIKGRPDATGSTNVAITPPSAYPQMMQPPMQPVGYGPNPGYPQYGPVPGYGPAPGYGPMPGYGPGYGGPNPGYNVPPQPAANVAKIRCKYCQTMMDSTSPICPNCGGHQ